jgi:hypothetical protein
VDRCGRDVDGIGCGTGRNRHCLRQFFGQRSHRVGLVQQWQSGDSCQPIGGCDGITRLALDEDQRGYKEFKCRPVIPPFARHLLLRRPAADRDSAKQLNSWGSSSRRRHEVSSLHRTSRQNPIQSLGYRDAKLAVVMTIIDAQHR